MPFLKIRHSFMKDEPAYHCPLPVNRPFLTFFHSGLPSESNSVFSFYKKYSLACLYENPPFSISDTSPRDKARAISIVVSQTFLAGPEPTLNLFTPISFNSLKSWNTPFKMILTGALIPSTRFLTVSLSIAPGTKIQSAPAFLKALPRSMAVSSVSP